MINLILISLLGFTGSIFGVILKRIAQEEIGPGKKYFNIMQRLFLFILLVAFLYHIKLGIFSIILFIIGYLISSLVRYKYLYLGIASALSLLINSEFPLLVNSIIFLYGLPYGSLLKNNSKLIQNLILYIIPLVSLLIKTQLIDVQSYLFAFIAGSLFPKRSP
ncbi:MAG: hypothetical protein AABY07_06355 [Nanoarchaeota archaeon]